MHHPNPDFFVCSSGDLVRAMGPCTLVREGYARTHREISTGAQLRATLRAGPYAWPGGYPLFFVLSDGAAASFAGVRANLRQCIRALRDQSRDGWRVIGCEINYEDPDARCAITDEPIPCAYA